MLELFAPAKVNLGLSVLGQRPDGYHELHSLMVPLSVGDELSFAPAERLSLAVEGAELPTDSRNLVYRAAELYLAHFDDPPGVQITLHKRLPLAAGLGGGSSDAATALLALSRLFPSPGIDLSALALRLGADVPFFLSGGPALAEGVGERLSPLELPPLHLVLVNPGLEVSAADAYRWLDQRGMFDGPLALETLKRQLSAGEALSYWNSLQAPVLAQHPELQEALDALSAAGLHSALMSGSGSTCFGLAPDDAQARGAAAALRARFPDWWIQAARSSHGISRRPPAESSLDRHSPG